MKKQFAVLGLGTFGKSVALTLEGLGCDVVAVDNSLEKVQDISDSVAYAMRADVADPEALQELGARNLDAVVVAVSDSLEASIMATIISKEMGIPYVMAKAKDERHGAVLEKVGADCIVYPERDTGTRVAKKSGLLDIYGLDRAFFGVQFDGGTDAGTMDRKIVVRVAGAGEIRRQCSRRPSGGRSRCDMGSARTASGGGGLIIIGSNEVLERFEAKR